MTADQGPRQQRYDYGGGPSIIRRHPWEDKMGRPATVRTNPFTREKIIFPTERRMQRVWRGETVTVSEEKSPVYDPACQLCPGNIRADGVVNPAINSAFSYLFSNTWDALRPPDWMLGEKSVATTPSDEEEIFPGEEPITGMCEVYVYNNLRHNQPVIHMPLHGVRNIVGEWQSETWYSRRREDVKYLSLFEIRGAQLGNSQPHPHQQFWRTSIIPPLAETELLGEQRLTERILAREDPAGDMSSEERLKRNAWIRYLEKELGTDTDEGHSERVVYESKHFGVIIPYWARWAYETLIIPKAPLSYVSDLTREQALDLAFTMRLVPTLYAATFEVPLNGAPYEMGVHQRPTDDSFPGAQFHIHFDTPLLTPDRVKHHAAYERYYATTNDVLPEDAAQRLRDQLPRALNYFERLDKTGQREFR